MPTRQPQELVDSLKKEITRSWYPRWAAIPSVRSRPGSLRPGRHADDRIHDLITNLGTSSGLNQCVRRFTPQFFYGLPAILLFAFAHALLRRHGEHRPALKNATPSPGHAIGFETKAVVVIDAKMWARKTHRMALWSVVLLAGAAGSAGSLNDYTDRRIDLDQVDSLVENLKEPTYFQDNRSAFRSESTSDTNNVSLRFTGRDA